MSNSEILKELKTLKNTIDDLLIRSKISEEQNTSIHQLVEDISKKMDHLNNGVTTVVKKEVPLKKRTKKVDKEEIESKKDDDTESEEPKEVVKKTNKPNILNYFKLKYREDETYFDSIMDEGQKDKVLSDNAEALDKLSGDKKKKHIIDLISKSITSNSEQKIKLDKMKKEYNKEHYS